MKLFVDDVRLPPDYSWVVVRSAEDAVTLLKTGVFEIVSFDHDLGENSHNGTWLATELSKWALYSPANFSYKMPLYWVHSSNPVGRDNMRNTLKRAEEKLREGNWIAPDRTFELTNKEAAYYNLPPAVPALIDSTLSCKD